MHVESVHIEVLEREFRRRYGTALIGENLCQFHSDFSSSLGKVICSKQFIALGKKCYLDVLEVEGGEIDYHIRMKGVGSDSVKQCARKLGISVYDLYERLYNGEKMEFNLVIGNSVKMKKDPLF